MKHQYEIQQILYNWVRTLSIDDATGESIVTQSDVDRLHDELAETMNEAVKNSQRRGLLSKLMTTHLRSITSKFHRRNVSTNLVIPL